jgi:putative N6-adenine-specific DNA methylase
LEIALSAESTRLHHKDSVEKKVRQAIHDALRSRGAPPPDPRRPHLVQRVQVRIVGDTVSLSLDAGGERLGVRGWRASQGKASLRENIAASLLLMAGYGGDEPLLDPFCGSGTIPIEGALIAAGRDPGGRRSYACDAWPVLGHREAPQRGGGRPPAMVYGFDHHGPSLGFAAENAARAGVSVDFRQLDVAELEAPAPTGLVVTNPPWGERLGQRVAGVYARFGETLRGPLRGWRTLFLCPDAGLARRVDPRVQELTSFPLGGSRVSVWALEANP